MKRTTVKASLRKDVMSVIGGLHRFNAPHAIGYLFTTFDGKVIDRGMYCDREGEIDPKTWEMYYQFSDKKFYRLSPDS